MLQYKAGESMIPSQMLKGTLEGCVLAILSREETYGYEISRRLEQYGFGTIAEGTIYPLLLRLEKNEAVTAVFRESDLGPKRKYYMLTEKGRAELRDFLESYRELTGAVERLALDMKGMLDEQTEKSAAGRE